MPFRMPPPTTATSTSFNPPPPSSVSPTSSPPKAPSSSSIPPSNTATATMTLRLPGPPLPPKPLYLTVSKNSTVSSIHAEGRGRDRGTGSKSGQRGKGVRGNKRGELPRWSRIETDDDGKEGEDECIDSGTVKLSSGSLEMAEGQGRGESGDSDDERKGGVLSEREGGEEEPTMEELLGTSAGLSTFRRKRTKERSNDDSFKSAVATLKVRQDDDDEEGGGSSTVKRKSIYFDPTNENPFLPPSRQIGESPSVNMEGDVEEKTAPLKEGFDLVELSNPSHLLLTPAVPLDNTPSVPSSSQLTDDSPQLELPSTPQLAVSLHSFSGETAFGELSFPQGVDLCVEVEDLGGGWSLGYVEEAGEAGRGLIPRGWYAYVDISSNHAPAQDSKTQTIDTETETPAPISTEPSTPSATSSPLSRRSEDAEPLEAPSYATRSIGRHLVISGTEFEPIETQKVTEEDLEKRPNETVEETLLGMEETKAREHEEPAPEPDLVELGSNEVSSEEEEVPVETTSSSAPEDSIRANLMSIIPPTETSVESPPGTKLEETLTELRPPAPTRPSPPTSRGSILYRLGLVSSPSSTTPSRSYLLGGLSIPGASILARSHPHRPPSPVSSEPKKERLSRTPSAMSGRGYVLEWVRRGDELDEEIKPETQIWNIDNENGPTWRSDSEPFVVQVHSPRKLSPLGETPYTSFRLTTHFPFSPSTAPDALDDDPPEPLTVSRRFSQFVSLHQLLIPRFSLLSIPPLPPKAFGATRFCEEFLEERRRDLERWIEKLANHPVLRESEEVRGFLSLEDDKDLHSLLSPSSATSPSPLFFARVFHPEFSIDINEAEEIGARFERHARAIELGGGMKEVETAVMGLREGFRGNANALSNLSNSLIRLVAGLSLPPTSYDSPPTSEEIEQRFKEVEATRTLRRAREWGVQNEEGAFSWKDEDEEALALSKAVQATGEALNEMAQSIDTAARSDLVSSQLLLQELGRPFSEFSNLIPMHKDVVSEYRRLSRLSALERTDQIDQLSRCETSLNITCAEMDYIRSERLEGMKKAVVMLLDVCIEEKENSLEQLRFARGHFDPEAFTALALTGPRLRSPLERVDLSQSAHPPLLGVRSFLVPQSTGAAVRDAIGGTLLRRSSTRRPTSTRAHSIAEHTVEEGVEEEAEDQLVR